MNNSESAQKGEGEETVHEWFELSYAQYLTVPRSIMEAMPIEWQHRITKCLTELDSTFDWRPNSGRYWVRLKNGDGKYVSDPLMQYRHPDKSYIESIRKKDSQPVKSNPKEI